MPDTNGKSSKRTNQTKGHVQRQKETKKTLESKQKTKKSKEDDENEEEQKCAECGKPSISLSSDGLCVSCGIDQEEELTEIEQEIGNGHLLNESDSEEENEDDDG